MKNQKKTLQLKFFFLSLAFLSLVLIVISCKSSLYLPTEANLTAGTSLKEMQDGRDIYTNKCGKCHWLHAPEKYTTEQWKKNLDKMRKRAKLTDAEYSLVTKYVNKGR